MGEMEERVPQVASYSDAQTSQATTTLWQQLEAEIVSVVSSTDETAAKRMHDARNVFDAMLRPNYRKISQTRAVMQKKCAQLWITSRQDLIS